MTEGHRKFTPLQTGAGCTLLVGLLTLGTVMAWSVVDRFRGGTFGLSDEQRAIAWLAAALCLFGLVVTLTTTPLKAAEPKTWRVSWAAAAKQIPRIVFVWAFVSWVQQIAFDLETTAAVLSALFGFEVLAGRFPLTGWRRWGHPAETL